ncbi:uncharacterized protein SAPINGB_P000014 [Magnusiomyces paraingens]|uniref:mRNA cap guanine-N(7) methyltransferase n=1 Tax=Magnusiomyces paraingens TaxID=2606893 RepID=A0A5E8B3N2_9ASCO|nr:uncharacterized protein SAPINGB_P000014 [Saprochaete ingens]VVT43500.1 unnamed protein product [Saprochaete ingens]
MYDPARDSWNSEEEETTEISNTDQQSKNYDVKESVNAAESSKPAIDKLDNISNQNDSSKKVEPSAIIVQNKTTGQSDRHELSPDHNSPPRKKLKRPSTRTSQKEREEKTRELRERLERHEKKNDHDAFSNNENNLRTFGSKPRGVDREKVKDHYNKLPNQGQERRKQSPIFKLRSFNNWVKSILIYKYAQRGDVVLDIGCGKGGDLWKWERAGIKGFIGIDVANVSIENAQDRYHSRRPRFWADFCVGDVFEQKVEEIVQPDAFPVSIVSCQFCLHYSFENESRVRTLLENISRVLLPGHYFIGTIPNSDVILKHIRKLGPNERKWGNSIYSVEFESDPPRDGKFIPPYGHKYTFFLEDAVGNVPEYVVPFESFRALCEEYDLILDYKKPFLKLFEEESSTPQGSELARTFKVFKKDNTLGIDGDEKEACGFYLAFAFRKKGKF